MSSWQEIQRKLLTYPQRKERDLSLVAKMDAALGRPHLSFASVHVGGTNGKGSVSLKIAKGLEKQGYLVGLYTSPHLEIIAERIQINSKLISLPCFERLFAKIEPLAKGASFFDVLTMVAFLYFQQQKVDFAVIEVGMGGRFDATNVISPKLCVITSIGLDHTAILGSSLEEIACEKGGIIKPHVPCIVGNTAAPFFPDAKQSGKGAWFEEENQMLAALSLKELGVSSPAIAYGIAKRPPCRFEIEGKVVYDVAHNPDGFLSLLRAIDLHFDPLQKICFLVAFSKDKDWKKCIEIILPRATKIFAWQHCLTKLEDPKNLCMAYPQITVVSDMEDVLDPEQILVVCGSFYFMPMIKKKIGFKQNRKK